MHAELDEHADYNVDEARALLQAGTAAYNDGRFADAEAHFRACFVVSGQGELLFNIAISADQARHNRDALAAYRDFAARYPDHSVIRRVRTRIAALEELENGPPNVDATPETIDEESEQSEPERGQEEPRGIETGIALIAIGVASLGAGGVLIGLGARDASTVEDAEDGTPFNAVRSEYDRSGRRTISGVVAGAVGVIVLAIGIAVTRGSRDEPRLRVGLGRVTFEGRF
ncbi:MAG: hypothetical protein AAGE52_00605 [Myxococcota bacterium]